MKFKVPDIYAQHGSLGEFEDFDRVYEQENMPKLIANGWPVNWNYVSVENACQVGSALVQRTLVKKIYEVDKCMKKISNSIRNLASCILDADDSFSEKHQETATHEA